VSGRTAQSAAGRIRIVFFRVRVILYHPRKKRVFCVKSFGVISTAATMWNPSRTRQDQRILPPATPIPATLKKTILDAPAPTGTERRHPVKEQPGAQPGVMLYFENIRPILQFLNDQEKGKLFAAILDFAQYGIIPAFENESPALQISFATILPHLERDRAAYAEKSLRTTYSAWTKTNPNHPSIKVFDQWIFEKRAQYLDRIIQAPRILDSVVTMEDSPGAEKIVTSYLKGEPIATERKQSQPNASNRSQYQSQSQSQSQSQNQSQSQSQSQSQPQHQEQHQDTETTSTGETFDAAKVKALELLNRR